MTPPKDTKPTLRRCAKCKAENIRVSYRNDHLLNKESLGCTCGTCGYNWFEDVLALSGADSGEAVPQVLKAVRDIRDCHPARGKDGFASACSAIEEAVQLAATPAVVEPPRPVPFGFSEGIPVTGCPVCHAQYGCQHYPQANAVSPPPAQTSPDSECPDYCECKTKSLDETGWAIRHADGLWYTQNDGEREGTEIPVLTLVAKQFPIGTRVSISEPAPVSPPPAQTCNKCETRTPHSSDECPNAAEPTRTVEPPADSYVDTYTLSDKKKLMWDDFEKMTRAELYELIFQWHDAFYREENRANDLAAAAPLLDQRVECNFQGSDFGMRCTTHDAWRDACYAEGRCTKAKAYPAAASPLLDVPSPPTCAECGSFVQIDGAGVAHHVRYQRVKAFKVKNCRSAGFKPKELSTPLSAEKIREVAREIHKLHCVFALTGNEQHCDTGCSKDIAETATILSRELGAK